MKAFSEEIQQGLVRVLLRVENITCILVNDAPELLDYESDTPRLHIKAEAESVSEDYFKNPYPLVLNEDKSQGNTLVFDLEDGGVWVDVEMEEVKDLWVSEYSFFVESQHSKFLSYRIRSLDHRLEWLELDNKTGTIHAISEFSKKFSPSVVAASEEFKGDDIMKCADMLGRAMRKIDIRTGGALVRFNTEQGKLESLLMGMADRLGYEIKSLNEKEQAKHENNGQTPTHSIQIKKGFA